MDNEVRIAVVFAGRHKAEAASGLKNDNADHKCRG
jgi:hypothetical protein